MVRTVFAKPIRESDIVAAVLDYLRLRGAWVLKTHGHLGQRPGIPDIVACYRGRFLCLEVKRPGGRLSPRQAAELAAIKEAGGIAEVVTSLDDAIALLERLS